MVDDVVSVALSSTVVVGVRTAVVAGLVPVVSIVGDEEQAAARRPVAMAMGKIRIPGRYRPAPDTGVPAVGQWSGRRVRVMASGVVAYVAVSLDGQIVGDDGLVDFRPLSAPQASSA